MSTDFTMLTADRFEPEADDDESLTRQWKSYCRKWPSFHLIETALRYATTLSTRQGIEYCASQWYFGMEKPPMDDPSIRLIGLRRAISIAIHHIDGLTEQQKSSLMRTMAYIVHRKLPTCSKHTCASGVCDPQFMIE